MSASFGAMEFKEADITTVKNIVERNEGSGAIPAKVNDKITEKSVVSTAASSMAELTFADSSITRMGSNTQFSFKSKERLVKLEQGTLLIHTPPGNGGATVEAGGVTAAVTGTTFMASRDGVGNVLFVLLEGQGGLKVTAGGSATVIRPGQAASVGAESVKELSATPLSEKSAPAPATGSSTPGGDEKGPGPGSAAAPATGGDAGGAAPAASSSAPAPAVAPKIQVFDIDVKRVVTTSPLVVDFKAELPSASKIEKTVETQQQAVKEGKLKKLEVEAVAVKSGDGDLLVGAPKVEKEEFVVVNKKVDLVGQSQGGGDTMDIETAAGPGAGGGGNVAAAPAPRAEVPTPTPAPAVNPVPPVVSQVANQVSTPPPAPSSLQLAFANGIGTVTLNRAALQTTTVSLTGLNGLPASVIIPAGSTSVSFALPSNPQDFFPGFANPANPSSGFQPLAVTASAGALSGSANAGNGLFNGNTIQGANPARQMIRTGMMTAMEENELAALDAFFYFRNAVLGAPANFYDSVRSRPLDLSSMNLSGSLSPAVQSLAGSANAPKDYVFGGNLVSHPSVPTAPINLNLAKPETVFFADQIRFGVTSLAGASPISWATLVESTTPWAIPDANPAGNSETVSTAPGSHNQLPLVARLSLEISPTGMFGANLGDFTAYLRHTAADGEARTVYLFDRIGVAPGDSGSLVEGLQVALSDWGTESIGSATKDATGIFTSTSPLRPDSGGWPVSLNDLVSINPYGDWTLFVEDHSPNATGEVSAWKLEYASVFQPQHTISLSVPTVGTDDRLVTFASGANGTQLLSTRWLADGADLDFVSAGSVTMKQTQFESLGSRFSLEASGKVKMGAEPSVPGPTAAAPDPQTIDNQQVRIMANTVTGSGGQQVPAPGSLAVIRSGDSLELRNLTIRSFAGAQLETVSGTTTTARVLMSGSSVRDFKIKELVGAAVNADSKIQMAVLDAEGQLDGKLVAGIEGVAQRVRLPVEALRDANNQVIADTHQVDLAARRVEFQNLNLAAMNAITARANTVLIQNSFMTVVQNTGMINMYVQTGLVNRTWGTTQEGYLNFAGTSTFRIGNVVNFTIAGDSDITAAFASGQLRENVSTPQPGTVNVLKL